MLLMVCVSIADVMAQKTISAILSLLPLKQRSCKAYKFVIFETFITIFIDVGFIREKFLGRDPGNRANSS